MRYRELEELAPDSSNISLEGLRCHYISFLCSKASRYFSGETLSAVPNLLETDLSRDVCRRPLPQ